MKELPTLVIFQGGALPSESDLVKYLVRAQRAATLDLLAVAQDSASFDRVILVTEDPLLISGAIDINGSSPLIIESVGNPFHFGTALQRVCDAHRVTRAVYVGGASLPLASPQLLRDIAISVSGDGECVVANSLFSADFAAFHPTSALARIELPDTDNNLPWLLHYSAGLAFAATPRTLATQFDIDTPPDLAVLNLASSSKSEGEAVGNAANELAVGDRLATILKEVPQIMPALAGNLEGAYAVMATRRAQVFLAGRISAWVWRRLEVNLPCQTRVLSEERGMQASGRDARGEARSLLGLQVDALGLRGMVRSLEETCDAAFLDTRVLFAHRRLQVSRTDRFYSDALMPELVSEPWVRELTEALLEARIPIVPGGHSLVAGGVWALSERIRLTASAATH